MATYGQQLYQAYRKATHLYNMACRERDKRGYRENLGYDSYNTLRDYVEKLSLTYQDKCNVYERFHRLCDTI